MKLAKTFLLPYLKRFWLMLLSVVFVSAFGCAILIGLRDAYIILNDEIWNLVEETGYPDLYIQTVSEQNISYTTLLPSDFNERIGAKKVEYRAFFDSTFVFNETSYSCKVISYDEEGILKHHLIDGEFTSEGLRLEYYFSNANNIKVGDSITLKMHNGKNVDFSVSSTFVSAESSVVKADPYSISSSRDFAYIYVPKTIFNKYVTTKYFNEILFDFKDGEEKDGKTLFDTLKVIAEEEGVELTEDDVKTLKDNIAYMTTYEDSEVISSYVTAVNAVNLISSAAPAAFFGVVLIVTALFLSQIVRQCRKDIGIMKALGESRASITMIFVLLGVVVAIISWALGVGIGIGITLIANYAYGTAMKLYPLSLSLNPVVLLIALGAILFVSVLTSLLASLSISKIKPVEAMKALPPMNNKTPYLVRTAFKNSPITLKIAISQTLRNLRRYILSGICLLASGMMIFVALSIELSKQSMMSQLYDARLNYDVQVYFDNLPSESDISYYFDGDENILDKTLIKYVPSEVKYGDKEEVILINAIDPNQNLVNVVSDYNEIITVPDSGIILSYHHAELLGVGVGEMITINDQEVEVKGISKQFIYQVSYMEFNALTSSHERGSLLAKVNGTQAFFEKYKDVKHVTYIAFSDVIHEEYNSRLLAFSYSSYVLNAVAIILGFMIVFNMMQTNLKEQKRTFSTIRTLGYQRSEISLSNLITELVQYVFAMVFAIPVGILLSKALLNGLSVTSQVFPFPHSVWMYILSTIFVLAFLLISHFIAMDDMRRWNLPESVKERE